MEEVAREARKAAYAELANFFGSKKALSQSEIAKALQLVSPSRNVNITEQVRPPFPSGRVLSTPLPRRVESRTVSHVPSISRIAAPSTQLSFRSRLFVPETPIVQQKEEANVFEADEVVKEELAKSSSQLPESLECIQPSPMKIEETVRESTTVIPLTVVPSLKRSNKFVGVFYLDPDEEEEELVRQEREAQAREERIKKLVERKAQREREERTVPVRKVEQPVARKEEESKLLFDFGDKPVDQQPLITLSPTKKTVSIELPTFTTKLGADIHEGKRKKSHDGSSVSNPNFDLPVQERPSFTFPTVDKSAFSCSVKPKEEQEVKPSQTATPAFSFNLAPVLEKVEQKTEEEQAKEVRPLSFGAAKSESKRNETKPAFSFGLAPVKEEEKSAETKPVFSFGVKEEKSEEIKPTFSFGQKQEEKPTFSFGTESVKEEGHTAVETKEEKPAFSFGSTQVKPSFSFAQKQEEKPSFPFGAIKEEKPVFSFGKTDDKPTPTFGISEKLEEKPAFTFGKAEDKVVPTFIFGATPASEGKGETKATLTFVPESKPSFSFGSAPKEEMQSAAPAFSFGTSSSSSNTPSAPVFSFGTAESKPNSTPAFSLGQPEAKPAAPFSFGQQPVTEAKPTTAFGAFGQPSSPKPVLFGQPVTETKPGFSFGENRPAFSFPEPAKTGFNFGAPTQSSPFSFGQTPAQTSSMVDESMQVEPPSSAIATNAPFSFANAPTAASPTAGTPSFGFSTNTSGPFTFGQQAAPSGGQPFQFAQPSTDAGFNIGASAPRKHQPVSRTSRRR